jgi:signal transduction histidine kinase
MPHPEPASYGQVVSSKKVEPAMCRSWAVPPLRDGALALGLLLIFELPGFDPYRHASGFWWAAMAIPGIGALAWWRVRPRLVWAITTGVAAGLLAMRGGHEWGALSPLVVFPAPLIALAGVAAHTSRWQATVALVLSVTGLESALLWDVHRPESLVLTVVLGVAAWALGDGSRSRRAYQSAAAAASAAAERARIARELHDIVAHHISVVALQAGTARMLAESGHPPDPTLLAGLESASRQAMAELRQTLGVLRHSPDSAAPQPGLDQLPVLLDRLADTGLSASVEGKPGTLPGSVDLAAYRVVQEGLTNVLRHSQSRTARVKIRRDPGALTVRVLDDGPARPGPTESGQGLLGLRERAATHGGWLRAGPRSGGGFELCAHLPLGENP